ncbi:Eisosome component PIL1/LSP1 family protein [Aspergillus saccharolyticus JOP 1030-1]|uniref:Sphingolipid long chain base-responsive protein PIL1 n=1 Tax=Aspergillus saccharolyticus JOP 1030-1 TaxID=1450539 RepID=A0A318Z2D1_9EURO|nr:hypothetical protein BP01DRAFT_395115 [Aspergillus saccharolyticus JOP 1030-1]PYH41455.1 hypothetical protein BP01DRAFT_395115 [Aspergillus saccharolyticus JOP 1030-1]
MCFTDCDDSISSVSRHKEYHHRSSSSRRGGGRCDSGGTSSSSSSSSSNSNTHSPIIPPPHPHPPPRSYSPPHSPLRNQNHFPHPRRTAPPLLPPSYSTVRRRRWRTIEESLIPVRVARPQPTWVDVRRADRCIPAEEVEVAGEVECVGVLESVEERCLMRRGGRNRNMSIRGRRNSVPSRTRFSFSTLRGHQQPETSRRLNQLIKNENTAISAHEKAGRERVAIANQLSDWGEWTEDDAVSDISDKLAVLMAEMGEQEDNFAQYLEESRVVLKHIRDTENSVQPSRDQRAKIADEIQKLKWKEPQNNKIAILEQELVRAEAQMLVAEAQLTNVTRSKFKEAYDIHLAAVIERGEKQILLARHARRLLNHLDDTPVVPGDSPREYDQLPATKQIIEDAEKELHAWESSAEPIHSSAADVPDSTLLPRSGRGVRDSRGAYAVETTASDSVRDVNGSAEESYAQGTGANEYARDTPAEPYVNGHGTEPVTDQSHRESYAQGADHDRYVEGAGSELYADSTPPPATTSAAAEQHYTNGVPQDPAVISGTEAQSSTIPHVEKYTGEGLQGQAANGLVSEPVGRSEELPRASEELQSSKAHRESEVPYVSSPAPAQPIAVPI